MKGFTKTKQAEFLGHVSRGMTISKACDALRLDRVQVRRFIKDDASFRERLESAQADADEEVQEAVWLSAVSGSISAAKAWNELRHGLPSSVRQPEEPEQDPLADLSAGDVVPLDPRRRAREP
jgi:hypothetical protein